MNTTNNNAATHYDFWTVVFILPPIYSFSDNDWRNFSFLFICLVRRLDIIYGGIPQ